MVADFDGVMIGRAAYQQPFTLARMAAAIQPHDAAGDVPDRFAVARRMADYAARETAAGTQADRHHPSYAWADVRSARRAQLATSSFGRCPRHERCRRG